MTNQPIAFAAPLLAQKGLDGFFEIVYGGDSLARKKPDPLPLLTVCADFSLPAHQVVAIGDSANDAEAARATCRIAPSILSADVARLGEEVRNVVAGAAIFGQPDYKAVIDAMRAELANSGK